MSDVGKIGAVMVLYNPVMEEILDNLKSFYNSVSKVYIVDNSDKSGSTTNNFFKEFPNTGYIKNSSNIGIAVALNIVAKQAIKDGCEWLLTMDQDSKVSVNMIPAMLRALGNFDKVGIISPFHTGNFISEIVTEPDFKEVSSAMTSGNLLNLNAYMDVGPFEENLFIDYVDHEYCLRLKKHGYKIILATKAILKHNIGQISKHTLGLTTNHNFIRRYYITRNRLWVRKIYIKDFPAFCKQDYLAMWKELAKICLFEKIN